MRLALALLAACACWGQNPRVGFYQWTSAHPGDAMTTAREAIKRTGAGLLRIYLGPRYGYAAGPSRTTPLALMKLKRYRALLTDPAIPTVALTVYPGIDYGAGLDDINLMRPWSQREEKAEYAQIFELVDWMLASHGDLAKTILIANTEADARLKEIVEYTGDAKLAIANVVAWQKTRYRAVNDARRKHAGATLRVLNVFEISLVNTHAADDWNALSVIVPNVPFDVLSYSAYETTNAPYETGKIDTPPADIARRLARDWAKLKRATAKPVMIGELGFSLEQFPDADARMRVALEALRKLRPEYVVFWQASNMPRNGLEPVRWGLLEPSHPAGGAIRDFIAK